MLHVHTCPYMSIHVHTVITCYTRFTKYFSITKRTAEGMRGRMCAHGDAWYSKQCYPQCMAAVSDVATMHDGLATHYAYAFDGYSI